MALADLMELSANKTNQKIGISEERIKACLPELRKAIAFYRVYPDLYIDFCNSCAEKEKEKTLHLYTYQRVFLRQAMRHKHVYAVFPRAYAKSFLSVLTLMLRCIFYPGCHLFVTTGGKEQATGIVREKAEELCKLVPGLANEVNFDRGKSKSSKEEFSFLFKNGSILDVMAARQSSRGKRATGGLIEECILVDGTLLNEVIIPTMNVSRLLPDGKTRVDEELINKSQIYVTTAGWKNTFAYEKLMMTLLEQITGSERSVIMGGTWRIPVAEGLLAKNFVQQLKLDGTYNDSSFGREYESEWSGDAENAYFSSELIDKYRVLLQPEYEFSGRSSKSAYYVLGIDVGRKGCTTECAVIKVTPQPQGTSIKTLVNLYSWEEEHFEQQAINIKQLFYKYKARCCAIDANGLT